MRVLHAIPAHACRTPVALASAELELHRFNRPTTTASRVSRAATRPNDNGPSSCDEGPLEGLCPVLPGVADGIQNGDLSC